MKMVQKPRKSLVAFALASAIGGALVSTSAHAVNLSPDGLGQALVFPYYTVKNGFDTYVHLTNTTNATVVAKIRFREAKNSREVRDFNIILSPYDVWTAGVTINGDGAKLVTFDSSCTSPMLPQSATIAGAREIDFTSMGYDGSDQYAYDNGGLGLERTQEGYFEVIAMGASTRQHTSFNASTDNVIEYNAKHVNGVPRDCSIVDNQFVGDGNLGSRAAFDHFVPAGNVLKGFSTLINVAEGQAVGAEPTVFANFNNADTIIFPPGDLKPDLGNVDAGVGASYVADDGSLVSVAGNLDIDVISALLMRRNVINEYTSTAAGTTQTDWVLTFPTKHNYTDNGGLGGALLVATRPFDEVFTKYEQNNSGMRFVNRDRHDGKSCVDIGPTYYDREERSQIGSGTDFSPRPAGGKVELCNEVNVLSFNGSNIYGSGVRFNIDTSGAGLTGWMDLRMGPATISATSSEGRLPLIDDQGNSLVMHGLPVTGFASVLRNNPAEAGNNRNYGVAEEHSYRRALGN